MGHKGASQVLAGLWGEKTKFEKWKFFYSIVEMSNLLDMTCGSHDERELPPAERRAQIHLMMVGRWRTLIVSTVAEFVWR